MQLSRMILYSRDTKVLSSFLSEMFDTELMPENETIIHQSDIMDFQVCPLKKRRKKEVGAESQLLEFILDGDESLESIKQKIQFFSYRHQLSLDDLVVKEAPGQIVVKDPDGRHWQFTSRS